MHVIWYAPIMFASCRGGAGGFGGLGGVEGGAGGGFGEGGGGGSKKPWRSASSRPFVLM